MSIFSIFCALKFLYSSKEYYKAKSDSKLTKGMNKNTIFAPPSPALSTKAPAGGGRRPTSLRASETGMSVVFKCADFFLTQMSPCSPYL